MGLHCIDEAKVRIARLQKTTGTTFLSTFAETKLSVYDRGTF